MNEWLTFFLDGGDGGGSGASASGQGDAEDAGGDAAVLIEVDWSDQDKSFLQKAGIDVGKVNSDPAELAKAVKAFRDGSVENAKRIVDISKENRKLTAELKARSDNTPISDDEGKMTPEGQKLIEEMRKRIDSTDQALDYLKEAGVIDDQAYEILSQGDVAAIGQLKNQQQAEMVKKTIAEAVEQGVEEVKKSLYAKYGLAADAPDVTHNPSLQPEVSERLGANKPKSFSIQLAEEIKAKGGK